jgi:hypothetical protein
VWASDANTQFTAVVTRTNGAGAVNSAGTTLQFMDGATLVGVGTIVSSTASSATYRFTTTTPLSAGPHSINAVYSGNGNIGGSASTPVSQNVHKLSKLTLTPSTTTPMAGTAMTFTVSFTGVNNVAIANAAIALTVAGTTFNLTTNASGKATVSYTFAAQGTYTVTSSFTTDGIYNDATASITLTVKPKTTGRLV